MYYQPEKTAYELKLLYEWCCPITDELQKIYESTFEKVDFSDKEKEIILANAIQLLKIKYHINIECKNLYYYEQLTNLLFHITNLMKLYIF